MLSHYITIEPVEEGWLKFKLSKEGKFTTLPLGNPKFDNGSWFFKNLLISFDMLAIGGKTSTLVYHPSAKNLEQLFDKAGHSAVDFAVFVANMCTLYVGSKSAALNTFAKMEQASVGIKSIYKGVSGKRAFDEGEELLAEHINNLMNPSFFAKEGFYDSARRLRYEGNIHKSDIYYGDCPPKVGRGNKMPI